MVFFTLIIEILHLLLLQCSLLDLIIGPIGLGELIASDHITHLGSIQSLAFPRFGELEIGYDIGLTIYLYFQTLT